jgi:hypothetical protein
MGLAKTRTEASEVLDYNCSHSTLSAAGTCISDRQIGAWFSEPLIRVAVRIFFVPIPGGAGDINQTGISWFPTKIANGLL